MTGELSFPVQQARTRRFSLGRPRAFTVTPDGGRVLFLRSPAGTDPVNDLWCFDVATAQSRLLAAATDVLAGEDDRELPPEERARRERAREMAGGIVGYATDRDGTVATFSLSGRLFTVDVATGEVAEESPAGVVFDPRPSPDGTRIAYTTAGGLHVLERGGADRPVAVEEGVTWGVAEFVAAEEMDRMRGFWWSPDGTRVAAARVDESPVEVWHIADPAHPDRAPTQHRYPAAGTANARVGLSVLDVDGDGRVDVRWDAEAFPYLAAVSWATVGGTAGPLTLLVQDRRQTRWRVLTVDTTTGATRVVREDIDDAWLTLVPGVPAWLDEDQLVMVVDVDREGRLTRSVVVDGEVVTPSGLDVHRVLDVSEDAIWFTAADGPFDVHVHRFDCHTGELRRETDVDGVHDAVVAGGTTVTVSATVLTDAVSVQVSRDGAPVAGIPSFADRAVVSPRVSFLELGPRGLPAALLLPGPGSAAEGDASLPVVLSPYGGPGHPRVQRASAYFLEQQWLADQGFAVLVVDNRGMPNLGPAAEREIKYDLATPVLEDQVAALHAAAELEPRLDLSRVGIRGWSFGGFLAGLAVLRRPDVFRAGVAGAPVADWRLYDTHYTERYLGLPDEHPEAYRVSSLVDAEGRLVDPAVLPAGPPPALMIIHGLADDNVVAAHSLRLSGALLAAGRPHEFLPLSGVTHMTPQEVVAENLLRLQVDFLRAALHGVAGDDRW
ncbi:MAG: S9 family peptidase [Actinobacteria bacterium]|nr:S9 family peptidase [Actinomycetota bacterium]